LKDINNYKKENLILRKSELDQKIEKEQLKWESITQKEDDNMKQIKKHYKVPLPFEIYKIEN
jgi:hypothetical protein